MKYWLEDAFISCPLEDRALTTSNRTLNNSHETENVTKPLITSLLIVKHAPNFKNFYLTIGDILQIPLILTHAQTKSNYTL